MRRRRRKNLPTTPLTLEIESLSHEGRGIAHHEGKVVFVDGALPGEQVEAILIDRRSTFDQARLEVIHKASPERVTPPCEFAGLCGGCSLQHFDPVAQLKFKESMLFEKLAHELSGSHFKPLEPLTGPVLGYRRKARLAVRYVHKKSQVLVGFREKNSTFITCMDDCQVLDSRLARLLKGLSEVIGSLDGYREIPQIEVAAGDPELGSPTVALIFRHLNPLNQEDIKKLVEFATNHVVALYLQPGGMESVHKIYPETGDDRLYYKNPESDLKLAFHPTDFTQINAEINRKMVAQAISLLQLDEDDNVLDLFCGLGNFTLPIARHCQRVVGIEGAEEMVKRGNENAAANTISNVEFYSADLSRSMKEAVWMKNSFSKVLLDPPRSGALEVLPDIVANRPKRIVYVSCNPATLARDAGYLVQQNYFMECAGVMDMFPQTAHVEAMGLFIDASNKKNMKG